MLSRLKWKRHHWKLKKSIIKDLFRQSARSGRKLPTTKFNKAKTILQSRTKFRPGKYKKSFKMISMKIKSLKSGPYSTISIIGNNPTENSFPSPSWLFSAVNHSLLLSSSPLMLFSCLTTSQSWTNRPELLNFFNSNKNFIRVCYTLKEKKLMPPSDPLFFIISITNQWNLTITLHRNLTWPFKSQINCILKNSLNLEKLHESLFFLTCAISLEITLKDRPNPAKYTWMASSPKDSAKHSTFSC